MAHTQISPETFSLILQARDFLAQARRLKPGPARNELREVAKVLREIARDKGQSRHNCRGAADHAASPLRPTVSTGLAVKRGWTPLEANISSSSRRMVS
jgi:hypothetical protein